MQEVLGHFEDDHGTQYVVLSEPDEDDVRNARNVVPPPRQSSVPGRGRVVPVRHNSGVVPPQRTQAQRPQPVQVVRAPDMVTIRAGKAVKMVAVISEGLAELIPLPEKPPMPTGHAEIDMYNQNEHNHALHAHRVMTSRIRASGRLLSKIVQMFIEP